MPVETPINVAETKVAGRLQGGFDVQFVEQRSVSRAGFTQYIAISTS
jgi:hypothetical protein